MKIISVYLILLFLSISCSFEAEKTTPEKRVVTMKRDSALADYTYRVNELGGLLSDYYFVKSKSYYMLARKLDYTKKSTNE